MLFSSNSTPSIEVHGKVNLLKTAVKAINDDLENLISSALTGKSEENSLKRYNRQAQFWQRAMGYTERKINRKVRINIFLPIEIFDPSLESLNYFS